MNAKTIRLIWFVFVAGAIALSAFVFLFKHSDRAVTANRSSDSATAGSEKTKAEAIAKNSAAIPSTPSTAPVATANEDAAADPTKQDYVGTPKRREFTPEQKAKLEKLREQTGQLESQIQQMTAQQDNLRAGVLSEPQFKLLAEAVQTANLEREQLIKSNVSLSDAGKRVSAAQKAESSTASMFSSLQNHFPSHLAGAGAAIDEACEWCQRDAERIKARDETLKRAYAQSLKNAEKDWIEAHDALRKAQHDLVTVRKDLFKTGEGKAVADRSAQAQKALEEAYASLPEISDLRQSEKLAREKQAALLKEASEIVQQGKLVDMVVSGDGDLNKAERKTQ